MGRGRVNFYKARERHGHIYTLPNVRYIASGKQPHSTGRSARCFVTAWRGGTGRVGGREIASGKRYGNIRIYITDSFCCEAETNIQL